MMQQIDSVKSYAGVFAALLGLTVVTTAVAYVDLGPFSVAVALVVAVAKTLLVALYFMHMRHSNTLTRLVVSGALLWLGILLALSLADFLTRGWLTTV